MTIRCHVHEEEFPVQPDVIFRALVTPSAIRQWWSASRAIVIPRQGGIWAAAWGDREDEPDYVTSATLRVFDPPRRLVFADYRYHAREAGLPFEAEFTTEFSIESTEKGSRLRVTQDGFPADPAADDFLKACETGWRNTFAGIRRYLADPGP